MQKDVHFYVTHAVAMRVGFKTGEAARIAWANYFTDDLVDPWKGVQTQCGKLDRWGKRSIQRDVIIPFHFIPGGGTLRSDGSKWEWATTPNCGWARALTRDAVDSGDLLRVGIALHAHQDTFSHQRFSGWQEDDNSCYPWFHPISIIPNVGHAEIVLTPDRVEENWIDPRTKKKAINKRRALGAARVTCRSLCTLFGAAHDDVWEDLEPKIWRILKLVDYDERKKELRLLSGDADIRFSVLNKRMTEADRDAFVAAAVAHRKKAQSLWSGLSQP